MQESLCLYPSCCTGCESAHCLQITRPHAAHCASLAQVTELGRRCLDEFCFNKLHRFSKEQPCTVCRGPTLYAKCCGCQQGDRYCWQNLRSVVTNVESGRCREQVVLGSLLLVRCRIHLEWVALGRTMSVLAPSHLLQRIVVKCKSEIGACDRFAAMKLLWKYNTVFGQVVLNLSTGRTALGCGPEDGALWSFETSGILAQRRNVASQKTWIFNVHILRRLEVCSVLMLSFLRLKFCFH